MAIAGHAAASASGENLEALHRQLLADPSLQFKFEQPAVPHPPPDWLEALARLFGFLAPYLTYVFWAGVIIVVALIAYAIAGEILRRLPTGAKTPTPTIEPPVPQFRPAAARARALLEEADRLAREGRFGEAVRILLHRSIEDMEHAFPSAIAPSMTSREISRLQHLSAKGRVTFTKIAQAVEASLFGGRALTAAQFAECRHEYEDFVFEAQAT